MSNLVLKIQPQFPVQITGTSPVVVTKSGLTYNISYNPLLGGLAVAQIKAQLVAQAAFATVLATIPSDPASPINAGWNGGLTQTTGPLMTSIHSTLGNVTQAQKDAFVAACRLRAY